MSRVNTTSHLVNQRELRKFFADIGSRTAQDGASSQLQDWKHLKRFFSAVGSRVAIAEKKQRQRDRKEATRFNVFDLIEPDENKLSDVLADLLDPKGNHGQGDLFLRLLFKQARSCAQTRNSPKMPRCIVKRLRTES